MTARRAGRHGDEVVYDLASWEPEQRTTLDGILTVEAVAYRWDGAGASSWMAPGPVLGPGSPPYASNHLVVAERHADLVEQLINDLDDATGLDALEDDHDDEAASVLSSLYVASDVLVGAPGSAAGAKELDEALEATRGLAVPYGVDRGDWDELNRRATTLAERLDAGDNDEEVMRAANALRTALRPLV